MHRGRSRVIATGVIHSPTGVTLVDPGPTSCLGRLRDALTDSGIEIRDVRTVLITHIHLDHAGAGADSGPREYGHSVARGSGRCERAI